MDSLQSCLLLLLAGLLLYLLLDWLGVQTESFEGRKDEPLLDAEAWDAFYAEVYDQLFSTRDRLFFEADLFARWLGGARPDPNDPLVLCDRSCRVLDVGCGTGFHADSFSPEEYTGLDLSPEMIRVAERDNPDRAFVVGDAHDAGLFPANAFTTAICMYFTLYQLKNQARVLRNIRHWVEPGGLLFLHVVDADRFDPILEPAKPFPAFSPQKYSNARISQSNIAFNNFKYRSEFSKEPLLPDALFHELFKFKDGRVREHVHSLWMPTLPEQETIVRECGWTLLQKADMVAEGFEYQYVWVLRRL